MTFVKPDAGNSVEIAHEASLKEQNLQLEIKSKSLESANLLAVTMENMPRDSETNANQTKFKPFSGVNGNL